MPKILMIHCGLLEEALKKDKRIIKKLNNLIHEHKYELALYADNIKQQPLETLKRLRQSCEKQKLIFPFVSALAICGAEEDTQQTIESLSLLYCAKEVNGAEFCRRFADLFGIDQQSRSNSIIMDKRSSLRAAAWAKGFYSYPTDNDCEFNYALDRILFKCQPPSPKAKDTMNFYSVVYEAVSVLQDSGSNSPCIVM